MKTQPTDRRGQRTCQQLRDALVALLAEQPYDALTVQHILDRANVGRSTFYTYFYDKEDLLLSSMEGVINALGLELHAAGEVALRPVPNVAMFRHVQEHYHLYEALARGKGAEAMFEGIKRRISRAYRAQLAEREQAGEPPGVPAALLADYCGEVFVWALRWWLENRMPYPPEEMDALLRQLVMPGLKSVLGRRQARFRG